MTCDELLQALNEYVEGSLDIAECREFADHLAGCNPCQIVVDNIRKTISLYKAGPPYPLPATLRDRLQSALRERWREKFGGDKSA